MRARRCCVSAIASWRCGREAPSRPGFQVALRIMASRRPVDGGAPADAGEHRPGGRAVQAQQSASLTASSGGGSVRAAIAASRARLRRSSPRPRAWRRRSTPRPGAGSMIRAAARRGRHGRSERTTSRPRVSARRSSRLRMKSFFARRLLSVSSRHSRPQPAWVPRRRSRARRPRRRGGRSPGRETRPRGPSDRPP